MNLRFSSLLSVSLALVASFSFQNLPACAQEELTSPSDSQTPRTALLLSQAVQGHEVVASPIPPVVSGSIDLEEVRPENSLELGVSLSRTFKLKNKIVRTSISNPGVAEPIVVSQDQIVLLGKSPGVATLLLWDDAGNSSSLDLHVSRDYSGARSASKEADPRTIIKPVSSNGSDRMIQMGSVDNAESVIRSFSSGNAVSDDRGMNIQNANNRLINKPVGERSRSGGGN